MKNGKVFHDGIFHVPCSPNCKETYELYKIYKSKEKDFIKWLNSILELSSFIKNQKEKIPNHQL